MSLTISFVHMQRGEEKRMNDLIYRQELLRIIDQRILNKKDARKQKHSALFVEGMEDGYLRIRSDVCQMPSADRKKGKWLYNAVAGWYCSECRAQAPFFWMSDKQKKSKYCYVCGAEMENIDTK